MAGSSSVARLLSRPYCPVAEAVRLLSDPETVEPCTGMRVVGHCAASRILSRLGASGAQSLVLKAPAAVTEPRGGSSLRTVETRLTGEGRLVGEKVFATNAGYARWIVVYASTDSGSLQ